MNADGSAVQQPQTPLGLIENPAWSPDGKWIAFQTRRDGNFEIYLMNPDGSMQTPLQPASGNDFWPSWGKQ